MNIRKYILFIWYVFLQDFLGAVVVLVSCVCSITSGIYGYASASVVGLAIAYAVMVSDITFRVSSYYPTHSFIDSLYYYYSFKIRFVDI